jgi:hypothetical protein
MPKSEHTYYFMKGLPKDDSWRFFAQLMYDKIDTLADKPEVIMKMKAHEAQRKQEDNSDADEVLFTKPKKKCAKCGSSGRRWGRQRAGKRAGVSRYRYLSCFPGRYVTRR